jgi:hypothetical protein
MVHSGLKHEVYGGSGDGGDDFIARHNYLTQ